MRGRTVLVLLAFTAVVAYSVGRQNESSSTAPAAVVGVPPVVANPVAFSATADQLPKPVAIPSPPTVSAPSAKATSTDNNPARLDTRRKIETALTAAAIAAIIVQTSRDQHHAGGRPCACPDDTTRDGRACGGRSAYSRPGGAAPLCYPSDVTVTMIESYRQRQASR
jgi:hypothetical protein